MSPIRQQSPYKSGKILDQLESTCLLAAELPILLLPSDLQTQRRRECEAHPATISCQESQNFLGGQAGAKNMLASSVYIYRGSEQLMAT